MWTCRKCTSPIKACFPLDKGAAEPITLLNCLVTYRIQQHDPQARALQLAGTSKIMPALNVFVGHLLYTHDIYFRSGGLSKHDVPAGYASSRWTLGHWTSAFPCSFFSNSFRQRSNRPPESPLTLHFEDVRKTFWTAQWWWALAARVMADSQQRNSEKHGERNCGRSVLWQWRWIQGRYAGRKGSYSP